MLGGNTTRAKDETAPSRANDNIVDFRGAVAPQRMAENHGCSVGADFGNVIRFARSRTPIASAAPVVSIDAAERASQLPARNDRRLLAAFFIGSLAMHAAVFAALNRAPKPLASAGIVSISVELVLGTDLAAGLAATPTESEVATAALAPQSSSQGAWPNPLDTRRLNAAPDPDGEWQAEPSPLKPSDTPGPVATTDKQDRRMLHREARHTSDDDRRDRDSRAATPSRPSSGIGHGRSDAAANYRGIVAAHLARYKQFPAEARSHGDEGRTIVGFTIDGAGNVTAVRLLRGSGFASFDQETQSMVRRASPFPPPPSGQPISFAVPVSFFLR
jgi:protein TonB